MQRRHDARFSTVAVPSTKLLPPFDRSSIRSSTEVQRAVGTRRNGDGLHHDGHLRITSSRCAGDQCASSARGSRRQCLCCSRRQCLCCRSSRGTYSWNRRACRAGAASIALTRRWTRPGCCRDSRGLAGTPAGRLPPTDRNCYAVAYFSSRIPSSRSACGYIAL